MTITMSLEEAARSIPDGAHVGVGGVLMDRKPMALLAAVVCAGVRDLAVSSFLAGLDVEILVAGGSVRRVRTGYVGFEHRGGAPLFRKAYAEGAIDVEAHSELTYTNGLDAAAAGLPFLPTRGAMGSDLVADLGLATIDDPYGGGELLAVPASPLDVAFLHTHLADVRGVVAAPPVATFLYDADAGVARAADRVIITAERVVDRIDEPGILTGFDVDVIVEAPHGSAPLGLPGVYETDEGWLASYLGSDDPAAFLSAWIAGER
jgi:glutaconate CoA-transferase subunit A